MNEYIDIYCERLEPGLWAEPLNALTNGAFFIAAFFAYLYAKKAQGHVNAQVLCLICFLCLIGTGSALFHTFATRMTMLMDVIPIVIYQVAFIVFYALRVMKIGTVKTAGLIVIFVVSSVISDSAPSHILNGSLGYAPAFMFLIGLGVWHMRHIAVERYGLLLAALVFAVSLTFRSIDMAVCEVLEIGTHFLWHCLNGCVLYMTTRAFINGLKEK